MDKSHIKIKIDNSRKGFVPYDLNGYSINKPFTNENAGFSKWSFCEKNGIEYFIKEFLSPVYPLESDLEWNIRNNKIKICDEWFADKKNLYNKIKQADAKSGNLVKPIDFFRCESHYYLVTEKVKKSKVDFSKIKMYDIEKKLILLKILADSFNNLSKYGVVHGDLKPDNLIIKETKGGYFTIKVIDFDAGYLTSNFPFGDDIEGDFVYFAPETYLASCEDKDAVLTPKVDVFALGIIFHQILCGEMPLLLPDYQYVYEAVLDDSSVLLHEKIPVILQKLIYSMLRKDPSNRVSVETVLDFLNHVKIFPPNNVSEENDQHFNKNPWKKVPANFD